MNKLALAIATTVLAVMTIFNSAAEAGMKLKLGFGGPLPHFTAFSNSHNYGQKHAKKRRARHVRRSRAKKKAVAKKTSVAKVVEEARPVNKIAETEQSSISADDAEVAESTDVEPEEKVAENVSETATEDEPETVKNLGCKKFFPSVAMTLTVPCE